MIVERFITYIRTERRYSAHTVNNYQRDVERFMEFLQESAHFEKGEFDPAQVTMDDAREWIVELSQQGLSPTSINRMVSSMRSFYRWVRKAELAENDPFGRVANLKTPQRLPSYVTEKQMKQLIEMLEEDSLSSDFEKERDALIILLFYSTGMRLAELMDVHLSDFSNNYRELKLRGKGGIERIVPIVDYTRHKLVDYLATFKAQNICFWPPVSLFLTLEGEPLSRMAIYRLVQAALQRVGIQGVRSPHVLRHTFATHMLNSGADIREIQELMGHSSLASTQVYLHSSIAELKRAYSKAHPRSGGRSKGEGE